MLFYNVLAIALAAVEPVCAEDDGVCLLQFMKRDEAMKQPTVEEMTGGFDFDSLVKNPSTAGAKTECPGGPTMEKSNQGHCSHQGLDIAINGKDIEDYFGDNVLMKNFKYYIEDCSSGMCVDNQLIDPDITSHRFPVGVSHVKVEGYDLSLNTDHCYRTFNVFDADPPVFTTPDADVDGTITVKLSDDNCDVDAGTPFIDYEAGGFEALATDNCDDDVEIVKKIYDETGTLVWDSTTDPVSATLPLGPGTYHMTYEAVDDHSSSLGLPTDGPPTVTTTTHTVTLVLQDLTGPYNFSGCPADIELVIEAEHDRTPVDWVPPTISGDNCGNEELGHALEQSTPTKTPGMEMLVGSHTVTYSMFDQYDNIMEESCSFDVHIVQKAHPVTVQCPPDVTVPTVENARSGIVTWEAPVAAQGDAALDASHIHFPQGVVSGMMLPFGITDIVVNATGAQTGTRVDEHLMFDTCTFRVTVTDPFSPKVDGREYRCKNKDSTDVPPFKICDGPSAMVRLHETYYDNFGYEILSTELKEALSCCESEEDTAHECVAVPGSGMNKYCTPV